jgi:coatomer protein complex subunit alpha (xenin)
MVTYTERAVQAKSLVSAGERNPRNAVESPLNEQDNYDICAATLTPIFRGSSAVTCPYTGATYLPQFNGLLDPLLGIAKLGAAGSGLPAPR